ncbi:MAG: outer membrane protein assembly factor BamB [Gammaproteobacteria bacterium]|jgi:outer membrane protein assembly factor BamB
MKRRYALVLVTGLLCGCSTMSSWMSGFTGGEDNAEPPTPLTDISDPVPLTKLWSTSVGIGYDEQFVNLVPAAYGNYLYVADRRGRVSAVNAGTGERDWEVRTQAAVSAGPGAGEGLVLIGTSDAEVIALDATDGTLLWNARVGSEVLAVPRIDLGKVIIQTADGNITALDASDGRQLWIYDRSVPVLTLRGTSTPAVQDGAVVAGFANGKLVALSADTGFVAWETSVAIPKGRSELERLVDIDADPVIAGGAVYVTTFQGRVAVLDIRNGNAGWKRDMSSHTGLGVDFSQVYVTDEQSHVWALSRSTGATEWKLDKLAYRGLTGPEPFDDYVAVGDAEGYLHLLSRYDGSIAARVRVDKKGIKAKPLTLQDVLYVYGNSGILAAYTLADG